MASVWVGADNCADGIVSCVESIDGSGAVSAKVECFEDPAPYGSFGAHATTFNSTTCDAEVLGQASKAYGICLNHVEPYFADGYNSTILVCDWQVALRFEGENCEGDAFPLVTTEPAPGPEVDDCVVIGDISMTGGCGNVCFHEDTQIVYNGVQMTLNDIQASSSPLCSVPHVIKADGVKISTTCSGSLRLTNEHLVYTQEGLKTAGSIKKGDVLFADMDEKQTCEVVQVEREIAQTYFGLNCEDSEVLADGYKTSTFGIFHAVPAMWMKYASKVIGVKYASQLGDVFANTLVKLNLL